MFDKEKNATVGSAFARVTIQFTDILGMKCKLALFRISSSKFMAFCPESRNRFWNVKFDERDSLQKVIDMLESERNINVKIVWGGKVK